MKFKEIKICKIKNESGVGLNPLQTATQKLIKKTKKRLLLGVRFELTRVSPLDCPLKESLSLRPAP